jgi:hypothetical protein
VQPKRERKESERERESVNIVPHIRRGRKRKGTRTDTYYVSSNGEEKQKKPHFFQVFHILEFEAMSA